MQFYIVLFDFYAVDSSTGLRKLAVIDRFLIDLILGPVPGIISRKTYHGMYNISQFDISFKIRCTNKNYYGPQCNIFCSEVAGLYTCDDVGNIVCTNASCYPATECKKCFHNAGNDVVSLARPFSHAWGKN